MSRKAETTAAFWQGSFGDEYQKRNRVNWPDRVPFWRMITEEARATSFLDVGCGPGWNLQAIRSLDTTFTMSGIDVNETAVEEAQGNGLDVVQGRADEIIELFSAGCAELVVTSGVLIHIAPSELPKTMQAIKDAAAQFVLAVEYEDTQEREVSYRGYAGKLWRRPYGKLYTELGLSLVMEGEAQGFDKCHFWLLER